MDKKIAVILFNLGGPDKPESIEPFLINFFMDKNIIRAPYAVRFLLSRFIAWRRSRKEAGESYGALGGRSPLLDNTKAQASALESVLGHGFKVFVTMRYWHPMADEVVKEVKDYNPQQVILLPLYPQFSTTTTRSSFEDWDRAVVSQGAHFQTQKICCYPFDDGFVKASCENIRQAYDNFVAQHNLAPRLLFSAHGLPEKIIRDGDSYQWACEESARLMAERLDIQGLDWSICYQSRVGPLKWIGPSTEEALEKAAHDQVPVLIYPHAFVSEHVETLVEIEEEYREVAHELGVPGFARVPTVSTHPAFIAGLANLVRQQIDAGAFPNERNIRVCPMEFSECCHGRAKAMTCCS
jgi:ferrochelatase